MEEKEALRRTVLNRLKRMGRDRIEALSRRAVETLLSLPAPQEAEIIASYVSMKLEPNTKTFNEWVWNTGRKLLLPRVNPVHHSLSFVETRPHTPMEKKPWGVMEPVEGEEVPLESIHFVLVPGVAFDENRMRLGRGGGFYDRLLACVRCPAYAVALDCQIVKRLPAEPHDRPVDCVVTPTTVYAPPD